MINQRRDHVTIYWKRLFVECHYPPVHAARAVTILSRGESGMSTVSPCQIHLCPNACVTMAADIHMQMYIEI